MKRLAVRLAFVSVFALISGVTGVGTAAADALKPDFMVRKITGPATLIAGLSGTFTVTITNFGNKSGPIELFLIFAGKLEQTGQIRADAGFSCEVGHDTGINASVRCTGGQLAPNEATTVTIQGRGQNAGKGTLVATINPSQSLPEHDYDNNFRQFNVTIN